MNIPAMFVNIPKEDYPVRVITFSPAQELVWDSGEIPGPGAIRVPGAGPGTVRYSVVVYPERAEFSDDPSCGGTVKLDISHEKLVEITSRLLEIVRLTAREMVGNSTGLLEGIPDELAERIPNLKRYLETQIELGEAMQKTGDVARRMLSVTAGE